MAEAQIVWRHGHPWRLVADGTYVLDAESESIGRERLRQVALLAWLITQELLWPGMVAIHTVHDLHAALELAGFDTTVNTGHWRTGEKP